MNPLERKQIGKTDLYVTRLGLGGLSLRHVSEDQATATLQKTFNLGIDYIDTAPMYGVGKSESAIGRIVQGRNRENFVVSTKVGRVLRPSSPQGWEFDFSREGVLRSWESSLDRLGLDRVDILFIHDPDNHYHQAIAEAYPTLSELRSQGAVKAIGAGMNQWEMEFRFAQEGDFDCFLLAGRYTLLEHAALTEFLPFCHEKGISVIIGGPFNSGVLATDVPEEAQYNYRPAPPEILAKVRRIKRVCDQHNVPLKAAALQFVLAHPAVASVIPGCGSPVHIEENFWMIQQSIPPDFWEELRDERLIPDTAPVPT